MENTDTFNIQCFDSFLEPICVPYNVIKDKNLDDRQLGLLVRLMYSTKNIDLKANCLNPDREYLGEDLNILKQRNYIDYTELEDGNIQITVKGGTW